MPCVNCTHRTISIDEWSLWEPVIAASIATHNMYDFPFPTREELEDVLLADYASKVRSQPAKSIDTTTPLEWQHNDLKNIEDGNYNGWKVNYIVSITGRHAQTHHRGNPPSKRRCKCQSSDPTDKKLTINSIIMYDYDTWSVPPCRFRLATPSTIRHMHNLTIGKRCKFFVDVEPDMSAIVPCCGDFAMDMNLTRLLHPAEQVYVRNYLADVLLISTPHIWNENTAENHSNAIDQQHDVSASCATPNPTGIRGGNGLDAKAEETLTLKESCTRLTYRNSSLMQKIRDLNKEYLPLRDENQRLREEVRRYKTSLRALIDAPQLPINGDSEDVPPDTL